MHSSFALITAFVGGTLFGLLALALVSMMRDEGADEDRMDELYRVWPDGTVQLVEGESPYSWMSDDYFSVWAHDEDEALRKAMAKMAAKESK